MTPSNPEFQNWAGGTLKPMKSIGINSRFALIDKKAQEQKWWKIEQFWKIWKKKGQISALEGKVRFAVGLR